MKIEIRRAINALRKVGISADNRSLQQAWYPDRLRLHRQSSVYLSLAASLGRLTDTLRRDASQHPLPQPSPPAGTLPATTVKRLQRRFLSQLVGSEARLRLVSAVQDREAVFYHPMTGWLKEQPYRDTLDARIDQATETWNEVDFQVENCLRNSLRPVKPIDPQVRQQALQQFQEQLAAKGVYKPLRRQVSERLIGWSHALDAAITLAASGEFWLFTRREIGFRRKSEQFDTAITDQVRKSMAAVTARPPSVLSLTQLTVLPSAMVTDQLFAWRDSSHEELMEQLSPRQRDELRRRLRRSLDMATSQVAGRVMAHLDRLRP